MAVFNLTLRQMLLMFVIMAAGFVLRKKRLLPENANVIMSKLETIIFVPALSLYTQMTKCTVETFAANSGLILYGLVIVLILMALSFPISALFVRNHSESARAAYERRIYQYAMTFSNFGFMGNFIILGVWGEDVFFRYGLFSMFVNILCCSWGLYILIPKEQNAGLAANLKKGLLTPPIIALAIGMVMGLTGLAKYVPEFFLSALQSAAQCQGPVAMLLAGFVIGGYNFKELILNKKVYLASAVRLIVIPAVVILAMKAFGADDSVCILALVCFGCPLGLNTIVYPSAYGGDPKTGASMAMISHTLSVITIPIMYLLLIEML